MACSRMQGRRVPTSCPNTMYTALAHSLLGSVPLTYEALQTPMHQSGPRNPHNQQVGAIENA
jgi:hypothetical protein